MDSNRANAPYVFALLWAFPKLFVALLFIFFISLFIYLFVCLTTTNKFLRIWDQNACEPLHNMH
jgi:hypothetical protein